MNLFHYIKKRKEKKKSILEDEKFFMEIIRQEEKRIFEEDMKEMRKVMSNEKEEDSDQSKTDEAFDIGPKKMKDYEYYLNIVNQAEKKRNMDRRIRFVTIAASCSIIVFSALHFYTQATPLSFYLTLKEMVHGKMFIQQESEDQDRNDLDFDVYQIGYMTEDYVLMSEDIVDDLCKMKYYNDKDHYVFITQASKQYGKYLSLTDETEYEIISIDNVEYSYSYNPSINISALYFIKENTSIHIRGTLPKEELFQIARDLYK